MAENDNMTQGVIPDELLDLRASIDNLDAAIIQMLAERFKLNVELFLFLLTHRSPQQICLSKGVPG